MSALEFYKRLFGRRLRPGENRGPCPQCEKRKKRNHDDALAVLVDANGGGKWLCHRCKDAGGWRTNRPFSAYHTSPDRSAKVETYKTLSEYGRTLWSDCRPLEEASKEYLLARGCALPPADGDLRFHPKLKHASGYYGPALVGLITDVATREPISLHRTWIQPNGHKANIEKPRLMLAGHRKAGGVIRLWPDDWVTHSLGIAEGIETALSVARLFTPMWAAIDAGVLGKLPVLDAIGCLSIFADDDDAGRSAAKTCATRWLDAGREVRLLLPETKNDFNDEARAAA